MDFFYLGWSDAFWYVLSLWSPTWRQTTVLGSWFLFDISISIFINLSSRRIKWLPLVQQKQTIVLTEFKCSSIDFSLVLGQIFWPKDPGSVFQQIQICPDFLTTVITACNFTILKLNKKSSKLFIILMINLTIIVYKIIFQKMSHLLWLKSKTHFIGRSYNNKLLSYVEQKSSFYLNEIKSKKKSCLYVNMQS